MVHDAKLIGAKTTNFAEKSNHKLMGDFSRTSPSTYEDYEPTLCVRHFLLLSKNEKLTR